MAGNGDAPAPTLPDVLDDVDLLLNFNYHLARRSSPRSRRSALVDIDPGLLQFWISRGFISPAAHDLYFTTGETVGTRPSPIPDCGIQWLQIRPPVCLDLWPYTLRRRRRGVHDRVELVGRATTTSATPTSYYDNTKRTAFFDFIDLPRHTDQPLELALFLAESDEADRQIARGTRLARAPFAGDRRQPRGVPRLRPALARRVQLGEGVLHEVPERLDQRPQPVLPGERKARGRPAHGAELVPAGRRGHVPLHDAGRGRAGASTRSTPTTSTTAASPAGSPRSTSTRRRS